MYYIYDNIMILNIYNKYDIRLDIKIEKIESTEKKSSINGTLLVARR